MVAGYNDYDVTHKIRTTDPVEVNGAVRQIYSELYPTAGTDLLDGLFTDATDLYRGRHSEYWACDTSYHNLQHVLDVTLAMARLMDGYHRSQVDGGGLRADMFRFGVMAALFHDCGYIRHRKDFRHRHGAEYTSCHVSRGARFVKRYLVQTGNASLAAEGSKILHFTGNEIPLDRIGIADPILIQLGHMLGSADIIAQMSDRCYLEKCYRLLYSEFVLGGVTRQRRYDGKTEIYLASAEDLIAKTPMFFQDIFSRLTNKLGQTYRYAEYHFGNQNLYLEAVNRNVEYARAIGREQCSSLLRRQLPP